MASGVGKQKSAATRRRDRNVIVPRVMQPPPMSKGSPDLSGARQTPPDDLFEIAQWFENQEDARRRCGFVFRDALDFMLDGQHTGRWHYDHLSKTEKTHLGSMLEITFAKEFEIQEGSLIDWHVAGQDLDCKFSRNMYGWEFPLEMYAQNYSTGHKNIIDHPAFVTWMCDDTSEWAVGLVRVSDQLLRFHSDGRPRWNGDRKRKIADEHQSEIYWLFGGLQNDLPRNALLDLSPEERAGALDSTTSGDIRMRVLFTAVQKQLIDRGTILTVGQQDDSPRRARASRTLLGASGIALLGHQEGHPDVARALGLPVCEKGQWLSVRLVEVDEHSTRRKVLHRQRWWAIAAEGEESPPLKDWYRTKNEGAADDKERGVLG
jgi:hypothetical protein